MTDRETLYSGLSNAAWGYFFLHFNLIASRILKPLGTQGVEEAIKKEITHNFSKRA